jgi:GntR family transcriptional regulator, rspAB operon transcriptional repressor
MGGRVVRIGKARLLARHADSNPGGRPVSFRRNTLSMQVHAVLRSEIIAGRLAPRAMLSEQEIASNFGISRTPVREAMIKLAEEGLVEIFPQYGSFVAPIKLRDVFDSQFAREALECAAVEKAVERLDAPQERELRAIIARQRALQRPQQRDLFFRADEDMHMLILRIAGHGNAWHFVESAKGQMDRVRHFAITIVRKQASTLAEHETVVDRLLARDRNGAVDAMRTHLRAIFRTIEMLRNEKSEYFADEEGAPPAGNTGTVSPQRSDMPDRQPRKYVAAKRSSGSEPKKGRQEP